MEQFRVDMHHRLESDSMLQREQIVQFFLVTAAPDHFEIQHHVDQSDIDMDLVIDHMDRAIDDVIQLVGTAPGHGVGGGPRAIQNVAVAINRGRKSGQRRGHFLGHAEAIPRPPTRPDCGMATPPSATKLVPRKFSR